MPDSNRALPLNPQQLRLERKKVRRVPEKLSPEFQQQKKKPRKPKTRSVKGSLEEEETQTTTIQPSEDMRNLRDDITNKNLLTNLSREVAEEERMEGTSTAKEVRANIEPTQGRLDKLDDVFHMARELQRSFQKIRREIDDWNRKYQKRTVDMKVDVRDYEKKIKKKMSTEITRIQELLELAERNRHKCIWIEAKLLKTLLEQPKLPLVTTLIELVFNAVQNLLWMLAVIRDYFTTTR